MPAATRRSAQSRNSSENTTALEIIDAAATSDGLPEEGADGSGESVPEQDVEDVEDEDEDAQDLEPEDEVFPPPGLKEISSLASWTVSTAKPGNGVAALRSPDTTMFWQSDGPQPHLLSIHFFKLVSIVHMRIYLDFLSDESYTPTKIQFLAGMGVHDIQEFAEMSFEQPTGWIDVDFSNVGPIQEDDDEDDGSRDVDWSKRPVLRAFLVQVRILENHQNGKDTHLRAVQLFARDDTYQPRTFLPPSEMKPKMRIPAGPTKKSLRTQPNNIKLASWMMEPDLSAAVVLSDASEKVEREAYHAKIHNYHQNPYAKKSLKQYVISSCASEIGCTLDAPATVETSYMNRPTTRSLTFGDVDGLVYLSCHVDPMPGHQNRLDS